MLPFITLAGLAFANLATASPCKPIRQTTVSPIESVSTTASFIESASKVSSIESESTTVSSVNIVSTTSSFIESVSSTALSIETTTTVLSVEGGSSTIPSVESASSTVLSIESGSTAIQTVESASITVSSIESESSTILPIESASTVSSAESASSTISSIESVSTVLSTESASSAISSIESVSSTALSAEGISTTVSSIESTSTVLSAESASSTAPVAIVTTTSADYPVPAISQSSNSSAAVISDPSSEVTTLSTVIVQETTTTEASTTEAAASSTNIGTSSGTATLTSETVLPTADQSCDNGGLDYAIYEHSFYNSNPPYFSSFNPTFFHDATPTYTGITERIGIQPGTNWQNAFSIYEGSPSQKFQYKAVDHHGFLYAPETGTYEVTVPNSDEITLVWFGEKALSSWTRDNADLEQDYPGGTSKSFQIHLEAGTYTAFRLLWANAQGELNFIAEVKAPGGQIIVNGDSADNKYLVREACDKSTPAFPSF
ncbi:GLEYA domain-containing protein [Fusarium avenaceum]|nr:GLEYA domain-containing protein [Fusarium avenaceum]